MSCGGVNQFVPVTVPAANGLGPIADVSAIVAKKTIYLSGIFDGIYTLFGSQDDAIFVPIAKFDGQKSRFRTSGPYTVKTEIELTLKSILIERAASDSVSVTIGGQEVCPCT